MYVWQPVEGLSNPLAANTFVNPTQSTQYTVRVENDFNCFTYDTVTINVVDDYLVVVSNVITANKNGENDYWIVDNIERYGDSNIKIFNRWGQQVYAASPYLNNWDGITTDGDNLPSGTYYYVISFTKSPKTYKGALTLFRN
jgi:gliding motility-associated-like protein